MEPTPVEGESGSQSQVSNDTSTAATSPQDTSSEVERLRKEREAATYRANQLANQLAAKEKAEEEARAKKLEEEGKLKEALDLANQRLKSLEDEKERATTRALLDQETNNVLSKYNPAVVEIAKTAGLSLVDDSDEAKDDLTKKLDSIASKVGGQTKVQANNPAPSVQTPVSREELVGKMRDNIQPRTRDELGRKAIGGLSAIKEMRQRAGIEPTE